MENEKNENRNYTIDELKQKIINYLYEVKYYNEIDTALFELLLKEKNVSSK